MPGALTAIDLFSGCGGLTLGLREAGIDVLAAIEVDRLAAETYAANHPHVSLLNSDIRDVSPEMLLHTCGLKRGEVDLVAGCPPCQGFSSMRTLNRGKAVHDLRNDLIYEFLKIVRGLEPKAVMLENVPGLASNERFSVFCDELAKMGYLARHAVLDASNFGVPQRRRRLILLAGRGMKVRFASPLEKRRTVRMAISSMPPAGSSGDPLHDFLERRAPRIAELIRRIPKNGGSRTSLPEGYQLACHQRCNGFRDVYGRMAWDDVAPTITSGCFNPSKGRFLHPEENRAITMREAALLQGFPPRYRFSTSGGKSAVALMIGNALPPPFIAAHARSVAAALAGEPGSTQRSRRAAGFNGRSAGTTTVSRKARHA